MPLFITSPSTAHSPGVYAVEVPQPTVIDEVSSGFIGYVGQFAWGPLQTVYTPDSGADLINTFEPPGSPRTSTGYLGFKGRVGFTCRVVRVLHSDAAAATATLTGTGGDTVATAKYKGALGNSITITQGASTSGSSTKRDYTVTLTDAVTGTTQEIYRDVPLPTGTQVTVDVSGSLLLASLTLASTMTVFPANGTTSLSTGSDGSAITASDYTGTAGSADAGLALFEAYSDVGVLCHDDCGDSLRAAVNLAFSTQAETLTDRIAVLDASPADSTFSAVQAEVVSGLTNDRTIFCGAPVYILNDAGTQVATPFGPFVATAVLNLEPQQSHAWRSAEALRFYQSIVGSAALFPIASVVTTDAATEAGAVSVCLPAQTAKGQWCALHDRLTDKTFATTRRIKDFITKAVKPALDPFVNGPNVASENAFIKAAVDDFVTRQVRAGRLVAARTDVSMNSATTLGLGQFFIAIVARSPAPREKIFLLVQIGPNVVVSEQS